MKCIKTTLIVLIMILSNHLIAQNNTKIVNKKPLSIGEKVEIQSEILKENRILNIYLPNGYSKDSIKEYPVIYLFDGSMDEDFIHISGLVQFGSFSWINMVPETIVVGISNIDRVRDYTFHTDNKKHKKQFPTAGKSEVFIDFIEKELQPFIDKNYKTNTTKTLIGQSLGGLLATEILFKKPNLFDNYIIVSPS
ncbi:MAG: alpha/beta hydrolase, partial [Flavobacteriaceae bacterium]|nr:alpha/beta hydrolase [Flavobacteriaceae bacterium]